jgi:hypothetical protein
MKRNDEIRRLLREADPAESRELSPVDRARMRATVTGAAFGEPAHRRYFAALAVGAALALAAMAVVAFSPRREESPVAASRPANEAPATPTLPAPAVEATTEPVVAALPPRKRRAHESPRMARLDDAERTTQILFTGPEGTKILWFVEPLDAKELGS